MIIMIMVKMSTWGSPYVHYLDKGSWFKKVGKPWANRTSIYVQIR